MNTPLNAPVLVVDDEEDLRDLIEMTLLKMGLEVDTADGVNAAKKKLDAQPYALVLTDMRMPDGSGLEVVEYLQEKNLDIPIAIITAYGNADQAVMALKAGAFDYIQKPVTLAQLRSLVKLLRTRSAQTDYSPALARFITTWGKQRSPPTSLKTRLNATIVTISCRPRCPRLSSRLT